jgi:hypothetical protein
MLKVDNKHKDELLEERNKMILKMEEFNTKIEGEKYRLMGEKDKVKKTN